MFPIHHTFGPHVTTRVWLQSLVLLLQPWSWMGGNHRERLRVALEHSFGGTTSLFASGRESLLALFRAMQLKNGEEVIVQAFTCVVVPNAIQAAGGVPIYADVDGDTLNLSVESVTPCITPRTRAVIVQHTFGIPGPIRELRTLCDEHHIMLIEDCAHMLPDDSDSPLTRTGDAVMMSFGRDKAIFGIAGGALLTHDAVLAERLRALERDAQELPFWTIARLLLYPSLYMKARMLSCFGLGIAYLALCRVLRLFVPIVTIEEKRGNMTPLLHRLPNACSALTLRSLQQLPKINDHRRSLTAFFRRASSERGWHVIPEIHADLPLQKFPLFFEHADAIREALKKKNIHLDDSWTGCTICPRTVDQTDVNYCEGQDPHAEKAGEQILSLPTHPTMTMKQAKYLLIELNRVLNANGE